MTFRTLSAPALTFVVLSGACGHDETAAPSRPAETGAAALDACALPRPCSWPISSGRHEHDESGSRCVVAELAAGRSVSVETSLVGGGPSPCEARRTLHFFADAGLAYYVHRKLCGGAEQQTVRRCAMLSRDAYVSCLTSMSAYDGGPQGVACSIAETDWISGCVDVEQTACP